jgi:putative membrane protein
MIDPVIADRRLHPGTILLRFARSLPQNLIVLPALISSISKAGWAYFLPIAAVSLVVFTIVHWLRWRSFRYGIGEHEVVIESGMLVRSRRTIPFDRIQDVDFEQGPLHRLFGLARILLETGSEGKDEGALDSVTIAEAERLRAAVRAGKAAAGPVGSDEPMRPSPPIFAMALSRVLLSGLFNFSLLWVAGIFALLQTFESWLPFRIHDIPHWIGLAERNLHGRVTPAAVLGVVILAVALGLASGVVSTLARDYGFRLTRDAGGFRRERGLLTRSEVLIPARRIQLAMIQSGPLRRALDRYRLRLQTLGSGKPGEGGLQDTAPFASSAEVARILAEMPVFRLPDPAQLVRVSQSHVWKAVAGALTLPLVPMIVASVLLPILLLTGLLIPLLAAAALIERRFHRYAFDDGLLFVQAGFWRRRLWIVPATAVQTATVRRSWFQRLIGVATVHIDTAGASALGGPAVHNIRLDLAEALVSVIMERNRNGRVRAA